MRTKSKKLTVQLPPTPVTPEMRESVEALASERGSSMAEIMREALSLFLPKIVSSTNGELNTVKHGDVPA